MYLQKYLPGFRNTQSLHEHRELTVYPNKWSFYSLIPKSLVGENYSSAEHLSLELNPTMVKLMSYHGPTDDPPYYPRTCARGKVIGRVVVVVDTKIAKSGDLGT